MEQLIIRNRRTKVSPGGIITLPVGARKALKMSPGVGGRVTVAIQEGAVEIKPVEGLGGYRVSAKGQMELRGEARDLLSKGKSRHYWLEMNDSASQVLLRPYE